MQITRYRHESPLGAWQMALCTPVPRLAGLIDAIWYGEGSVSYQRDRILPAGQSQLLINLGPQQYMVVDEERIPFRDVWYSSLQQGPIDTEAPHGTALLGVAFKSHGAFPWLGPALSEVRERVLPLEDVIGASAKALRERLLNTPTLEARFALVQHWIIARLDAQPTMHPAVQWAVERLVDSGGQASVVELAARLGYTRKHMAHLFQTQIGLNPKSLARVLRFRNALSLLQGAHQVPWAALADHCGYFDQSHLTRDFRAFAGLTPTDFLRCQQPDGQSIVIR